MTPLFALADTQSILLVEDSEDDYEATVRACRRAHLLNPIVWCKSGREALDLLNDEGALPADQSSRPGLALLDLNMPGLDGQRTLQLIKRQDSLKSIPVIIFTTSSDQRDVQTCYQMGSNTYIQKPIHFDGLIVAMKGLKAYWFEFALLPRKADNV